MFKNIIFDWSGPIKDLSENHLWVVKKMFERLSGKEISDEEIKKNYEEPYMNFWHKYFPELTIAEEQKLYKEVQADPKRPKAKSYGEIVNLIKKCKTKSIKMVVLSSDFPETILPEVEDFGLNNIFQDLNHSVHDKSEAIHKLLIKNKFKASETVFVGDSNNEMDAGHSAGMKTIGVTWGFTPENTLKKSSPDYLVHNIKELESILLK